MLALAVGVRVVRRTQALDVPEGERGAAIGKGHNMVGVFCRPPQRETPNAEPPVPPQRRRPHAPPGAGISRVHRSHRHQRVNVAVRPVAFCRQAHRMNRRDKRVNPRPPSRRQQAGAMPLALHFRLGNRIQQQ